MTPPIAPTPLSIAYFGLPLGALLLLEDGHALTSCVLSPVPAPGRRRLLARAEVPVVDAAELEREELEATVDALLQTAPPELLVSWFWTRLLPERWLRAARSGGIGVHPSLLPRHRGPNPYYWAIDSGDVETGVSVHRLEPEYDTGAVLGTERLVIGERNSWQLARALDRPSLRALRRTVRTFAEGSPPSPTDQVANLATTAPEPTGSELKVDFGWPTARVLRRIRALSPVPGLALELAAQRFFVTAAVPAAAFVPALRPGEAELSPHGLLLRTGDAAIRVEKALCEHDDEDPEELNGAELVERLRKAGASSVNTFNAAVE